MSLRILFLSHRFYPYVGGIEVNSELLATAFQKAGHHVKLVTWTAEIGNRTFPFEVIRKPELKTLFRAHRWADVVFENNPCLRLAWPGIFFRKPYVVALRTWVARINGEIGIQDKFKTHWLKRAAAVIAVSDAVRAKSWPPATVIGNPYRAHLFYMKGDTKRVADFVFLGRLVSDKGADHAIKAIHRLKQMQLPAFDSNGPSLSIIGDGDQLQVLKDMSADLGVTDNVSFKGALSGETLVNCLNQHKYLLVPSVWEEPFGNVALEGMACGCIPIVSDGGGLPDAAGKAGVVFERGNTEALVHAILSVVNNPDYATSLRQAVEVHLDNHHPDVVAKRYLSIIEKAAAN